MSVTVSLDLAIREDKLEEFLEKPSPNTRSLANYLHDVSLEDV